VVISWFNEKQKLDILSFSFWKRKIQELKKDFSKITAAHIFRENNLKADFLSKKALQADEGLLSWRLLMDDSFGPTHLLDLKNLAAFS